MEHQSKHGPQKTGDFRWLPPLVFPLPFFARAMRRPPGGPLVRTQTGTIQEGCVKNGWVCYIPITCVI